MGAGGPELSLVHAFWRKAAGAVPVLALLVRVTACRLRRHPEGYLGFCHDLFEAANAIEAHRNGKKPRCAP